MYFMMDTALVQNEGHRSKLKVTRLYYVKIGQAAEAVFCALCAWPSTHYVLGQSLITIPGDR